MAFNLTKINQALTNLTGWVRTGFSTVNQKLSTHDTDITDLQENKASWSVGRFVGNEDELNSILNASPDQSVVFNSWHRFSHNSTETQPANTDELSTWSYDTGTKEIHNTTNSATFIGVVSVDKYEDYIFETKLSSTDVDDDMIGVVLAFYTDPSSGREYTLIAYRSPGGLSNNGSFGLGGMAQKNFLYGVAYNFLRSDGDSSLDHSELVTYGNNAAGNLSPADAAWVGNTPGWGGMAAAQNTDGSTMIRAVRSGNIIKVSTSQWNNPDVIDPSTEITIDLSADPKLQKFMGPQQYGFCSLSQTLSTWDVDQFTNPVDKIYDLSTGNVYLNNNGVWAVDPNSHVTDLPDNSLLYNPDTNQLFYMKDADTKLRLPAAAL
uniref:Tail fiber protein n=1 Tax=Burkholderia phage vB_BgluM-SURPRISE13 TaxID=3159457 RepID=A0AAU7PF29_9VIRU